MKTKIILASSSPRRIEMMHEHNMMFEIIPADVDETLPLQLSLEASVMFLALKKAMAVENMLCKKISDGEYDILCKNIITAADTLVCCDGILGKPADKTDAYNMLTKLRARKHIVSTGVAMICLAPQKTFQKKQTPIKNWYSVKRPMYSLKIIQMLKSMRISIHPRLMIRPEVMQYRTLSANT